MLIAEVKLNPKKISIQGLQKKAQKLIDKHQDYEINYSAFSLDDI